MSIKHIVFLANSADTRDFLVSGKVYGEFQPGNVLTLIAGTYTASVALAADGLFSFVVPYSPMNLNVSRTVTAILNASDAAGNTTGNGAQAIVGSTTYTV